MVVGASISVYGLVIVEIRKSEGASLYMYMDHNLLVRKLLAKGVPHCLIKWLHSYLSNCLQRVQLPGKFSTWTTLAGGMPQGPWLGPVIYYSD